MGSKRKSSFYSMIITIGSVVGVAVILVVLAFSPLTIHFSKPPPNACLDLATSFRSSETRPVLVGQSVLPSVIEFARLSDLPIKPETATLIDVVTVNNTNSILSRLLDGRFMLYNPKNSKELQVFNLNEQPNSTVFSQFKVVYTRYLLSLMKTGDLLEAISWKGAAMDVLMNTGGGFTSLGLWRPSGQYKYDSAMHWNIKATAETPQYSSGRSAKVVWPFLVGNYANGFGQVAFNFTLSATASGNGTRISSREAFWLNDNYSGFFELTEKSIQPSIMSQDNGTESAHFAIKVTLIWNAEINSVISAKWAVPYSREGYLDLYANNTCNWGPRLDDSIAHIFLLADKSFEFFAVTDWTFHYSSPIGDLF